MNKLFTNTEYVEKALKAFRSVENCYSNANFGSDLTNPEILFQYTHETPWCRTHAAELTRKAEEAKNSGVPLWGWDCVCFVKGLLWGWDGDTSKPRGGATYKGNNVPDATIWDLYTNYCTDKNTDFSSIVPGEFVVLSSAFSHCGIYIGGGYVLEATAAWDSKIQISVCNNCGTPSGEYDADAKGHARTWYAHGKLPWIDYGTAADYEFMCPHCGKKIHICK